MIMFRIKLRRFIQVFQFGWDDANEIAKMEGQHKSRLILFLDILHCFQKYYLTGIQYRKNRLWELTGLEKHQLATRLGNESKSNDNWLAAYYRNWSFIEKYSGVKWETSQNRRKKRNEAYTRFYGFGKNCWTQRDVSFIFEHFRIGNLKVGDNCFFARGCDIDITGDLIIGNNAKLSENVKILTHNHDVVYAKDLIITPLTICEDVRFGARVLILPGVKKIGRGAVLSAGAIVKHEVPPYAVVMGNPAKVIGFRFSPNQIVEYEEDLYSAENRLSEELLSANYKKYYLDRITEISTILK